MKELKRVHGLHFGKSGIGSVHCSECGQLLCYIYQEHCTDIYLHLICKCGHSGYLSYGMNLFEKKCSAMADLINHNIYCDECHRLLFYVTDQVSSFAFRAQCGCGRYFDRMYRRKRKLYDAKKILQESLHNSSKNTIKEEN